MIRKLSLALLFFAFSGCESDIHIRDGVLVKRTVSGLLDLFGIHSNSIFEYRGNHEEKLNENCDWYSLSLVERKFEDLKFSLGYKFLSVSKETFKLQIFVYLSPKESMSVLVSPFLLLESEGTFNSASLSEFLKGKVPLTEQFFIQKSSFEGCLDQKAAQEELEFRNSSGGMTAEGSNLVYSKPLSKKVTLSLKMTSDQGTFFSRYIFSFSKVGISIYVNGPLSKTKIASGSLIVHE